MKDERIYLVHMLETAERVATRFTNVTRATFDSDEDLLLAATHLLQIIGEAARLISEPTRAQFPEIPWRTITGMRHRLVHEYITVNPDTVWDTATAHMRPLIERLNQALLILGDPRNAPGSPPSSDPSKGP